MLTSLWLFLFRHLRTRRARSGIQEQPTYIGPLVPGSSLRDADEGRATLFLSLCLRLTLSAKFKQCPPSVRPISSTLQCS